MLPYSLFGMEGEFAVSGTKAGEALPTEMVVGALAEMARRTLPHLPGGGSRTWFTDGSCAYIDVGAKFELCTSECSTPWELVCQVQAGNRLLANLGTLVRAELQADKVLVARTNVDYVSGSTWGCHESYLGRQPVASYEAWLIAHLVSRIIFTGSGGLDPSTPGIRFSCSPRVAHLEVGSSHHSTARRGIWHTRDEPLARNGYSRIHLLTGNHLCSQRSTWLQVSSTALIVALGDQGAPDDDWPRIADPVRAIKAFATDPHCRAQVNLGRGPEPMSAVEIQRHLLSRVRRSAGLAHMPPWAEEACAKWQEALDLVESPQLADSHAFDYPLKFALFRAEIARRGFSEPGVAAWSDTLECLASKIPGLADRPVELDTASVDQLRRSGALTICDIAAARRSLSAHGLSWRQLDEYAALRRELCVIDVRFGELVEGVFETLDRQGLIPDHHVVTEEQIRWAQDHAPETTRAHLRGMWVSRLAANKSEQFLCSWEGIRGESTLLDLGDPFAAEAEWKPYLDPHNARTNAFEHYAQGRYLDAEALLQRILATGFEPADIRCHLARACIMLDRIDDAGTQAEEAWRMRGSAAPYVVARTLWTRLAIAYLDTAEETTPPRIGATASHACLLGQLKTVLRGDSAFMDWTMHPVLERLEARLTGDQCSLLRALVQTMSTSDSAPVEALPAWRDVDAAPLRD